MTTNIARSVALALDADRDRFVDLPTGPRICYRQEGPFEEALPLIA